ncbi:MAG: DUF4325 domain-containing protein [Clostridiaceae bacterium]
MNIKVKDFIGENLNLENAIVLKDIINASNGEEYILDFQGITRVNTTFFLSLFNDVINEKGRDYVLQNFKIVNLNNEQDFYRVLLGTHFVEKVKIG